MTADTAFEALSRDAPERSLRDLMGLLALPALWAGRDGRTVIELMIEAVERIVRLDICYAHVPLLPDAPAFDSLRLCEAQANADTRLAWEPAIKAWQYMPIGPRPVLQATPAGARRLVRMSMGYTAGQGSVWFGSAEPSFPSVTDLAFLRAATSLAATGLQAARATHERETASRAKDEFLAMLGHELRNPLAPITTALGLIRKHRGGTADKYHDIIERQVSHLSRLVEDLLDVSRITRGSIELHLEPVRIGSVLTRAIEAASPLIEQRGQTLSLSVTDDGALISADLTRLTQVFGNLLNNAAKYTDPGGNIRVDAVTRATDMVVSVSDNGAGISDELMPRLFTIFEQGRTTIDRAKGGLGIGLALVKNLVELHGGTVTAMSDGPGKGSTFVVTLPTAPHALVPADAPPHGQSLPEGNGVRVLLVDDNEDGLLAMEAFLTELGFEVATASLPETALRVAAQFCPAFAVLDIGLPGMDGYQLADALQRQHRADPPRLFALTGYGQADDRKRSADAGFERHFVKPVPLMELAEALSLIE
ncbi:Histidine kinase [Burkholderia sp. 8Y]|uniref:hybrid sensor histidine kinase/response regulator n=1 Tax=Burkholderia sp. 8Y TaxID=2653133 RepID=UPI0012F0FA60|nr:hybrid sensor histidine kinase/response regulator [Burkholderia sp. 8Y]VXC70766.1 Histidine kinase [Burkholderia sp. 8Y]